MVTERVILSFESRGARRVKRDINSIGGASKSSVSALGFLRSALVVVASARIAAGIADVVDSFTNLRNRLKLVTSSTEELNAVQAALIQLAKETRTPLDATVTLFQRLARSTLNLNLTFNGLLGITRTINQALVLSGATAQEARNGLIQFSQGLAAGALRGDELRSVVEQLPFLADIIGKEFGISGGSLISFAKSAGKASIGALNTKRVIAGLQKAAAETSREFLKLAPTIQQGFIVLGDALSVFLGKFSESSRVGALFGRVLGFIADNLENLARALAVVGAALLAAFTVNLVRRLAIFVVTNPFRAFVIGALAAASAVAFFGDRIQVASGTTISLLDVVEGTFQNIGKTVKASTTSFDVILTNFGTRSKITFRLLALAVELLFARVVNSVASFANQAVNSIIRTRNTLIRQFGGRELALLSDNVNLIDESKIVAQAQKFIELRKSLASESSRAENSITQVLIENGRVRAKAREDEAKRAAALSKLLDRRPRGLRTATRSTVDSKARDKLIKQLNTLRASISPLAAARQRLTVVTDLLNKAEKAGIALGIARGEIIRRVTRDLIGVGNATTDYKEKQLLLNKAQRDGVITSDELTTASRKLRIEFLDTQDTIAAGAERGLLKFAQESASAGKAIEESLTSAFSSVEDALVKFVETGKFSFKDLADSILKDLTRIAVRQAIAQAVGFATSSFGPSTTTAAPSGDSTDALVQGALQLAGAFAGSFQQGGQVKIGGTGGPDSQLFAARLSPGETATFTPPGQAVGGTNINFNVQANDAESFNRSRDQIMSDLAFTIERANRRNN